jgi:hypothetical protein
VLWILNLFRHSDFDIRISRHAVFAIAGPSSSQLVVQMPPSFPASTVVLVGVGLMLVLLVWLVVGRWLRRSRDAATEPLSVETIDVSELADSGPVEGSEHLTFYHVPVRLALLVLAPVGREGRLPDSDQLPELVDQLVPGLMRVLQSDRPQFRRWPAQLSSEGFTKAFFGHVRLPGDRGRGTPWCSIAGKFETEDRPYLAGLVCRAATRNSLSQVAVEHAGKWLDVLRVCR